jgi:hypothetical protein
MTAENREPKRPIDEASLKPRVPSHHAPASKTLPKVATSVEASE